jgi:hypothetical protein
MDPVITPTVIGAALATPLIGGATVGSVLGNTVMLGLSVTAGILLQPHKPRDANSNSQVTLKQASPARVRAYGRVKLGGSIYFMAAPYALVQGFIFCEGPIDEIEEVWLNDRKLWYSAGSGVFNTAGFYPWRGFVHGTLQTGTSTQPVDPTIHGKCPWFDAEHDVRGSVAMGLVCGIPYDPKKNFSLDYPTGVPSPRIVLRAELVYDPRDITQDWADAATWKWSDNSALCILDYLTHWSGFNIPNVFLNAASFGAFADVCDEMVTKADGTTVKRYRLWGSYDLTEEKTSVLQRMIATCDARLFYMPDGTLGITGGVWDAPTVTIPEELIIGYEIHSGTDKLAAFTQFRVRYTEPDKDYQLIETPVPWDDVLAQARAGGQVIEQALDLPMAPDPEQALRLAKIYMAKANPEWRITIQTSISGIAAFGQRIITLWIPELNLNRTFEVQSFEFNVEDSTFSIGLASLDAEAYNWGVDQGILGVVPASGSDLFDIPDVTGLTVTIIDVALATGLNGKKLRASVTPPADESFILHVQLSADAGSTWIDMTLESQWVATSDIISIGTDYQVRAAFRTFGGTDGAWSTPSDTHIDVPSSPGGVADLLLAGGTIDYGLASAAMDLSDDFGFASESVTTTIDLGLASA